MRAPSGPRGTLGAEVDLPTKGVTLVLGPSGAGKSLLLRRVVEQFPDAVVPREPPDPQVALVDQFHLGLSETIELLGRFGLAEAKLLCRPMAVLSAGQRARASLALMMQDRPNVVVIDEFLNDLDRLTAQIVAFNLGRLCRQRGVTAYLASATADDLIDALGPDHLVRHGLDGPPTTMRGPGRAVPPGRDRMSVADGTLEDYAALAQFHYVDPRADLGGVDGVRRVRVVRYEDRPVAVAVTGRPFARGLERIDLLAELNRKVEIQLRTIVHPQFRGMGLTRLLDLPAEEGLECRIGISAMSQFVPFQQHSIGASPLEPPRNRRTEAHDRLDAWLAEHGEPRPEALHDPEAARALIDRLDEPSRAALRQQCIDILSGMNAEFAAFLARELGLGRLRAADLSRLQQIFARLLARTSDGALSELLDEAIYFPVQGWIRRYDRPADQRAAGAGAG
ncbi:MAG: AAA family ATPase [Myxococcota bacterium]